MVKKRVAKNVKPNRKKKEWGEKTHRVPHPRCTEAQRKQIDLLAARYGLPVTEYSLKAQLEVAMPPPPAAEIPAKIDQKTASKMASISGSIAKIARQVFQNDGAEFKRDEFLALRNSVDAIINHLLDKKPLTEEDLFDAQLERLASKMTNKVDDQVLAKYGLTSAPRSESDEQ